MSPTVPETLWREVAGDLRPVRPLPAPALRTLEVAVWAIAVLLLVLLLLPVRRDAEALGWLLMWGVLAAEGLAGLLLIGLALREAVPASGLGPGRAALALLAGAAIETAIGLQTWLAAPTSATAAHHSGLVCFSAQGGLGFTGLAVAFWLVVRALPVRPPWAGALAGMGTGLVADGVWHLVCPRADLVHLLVAHGGATLALTGIGWALGWLWEMRQAHRLRMREPLRRAALDHRDVADR